MSLKDQVFSMLKQSQDEYLSGEWLSEQLGVSRTAVWKAIHALQQQGCMIEAVTKRGYRLCPPKEGSFSSYGLQQHLRTNWLGKKIWVLETVSSTNDYLKQLERSCCAEQQGAVVLAGSQSKGKAKANGTFYSPADGGIYLSVLLMPQIPFSQLALLRQCVADSMQRAVSICTGATVYLDSTNILYWQKKRIGGILLEASVETESEQVQSVIAGIGIYVNCQHFPEEQEAVSLMQITGQHTDRLLLAGEFLNALEHQLEEKFPNAPWPQKKQKE